jgi:hypothetical protein
MEYLLVAGSLVIVPGSRIDSNLGFPFLESDMSDNWSLSVTAAHRNVLASSFDLATSKYPRLTAPPQFFGWRLLLFSEEIKEEVIHT